MKDYYTRQEVAEILGLSNTTIYNYAKQKKIIKIKDPHRLIREARYQRKEVDTLALEREKNTLKGIRPSVLAKRLEVPVSRIYSIIKDKELDVKKIPLGDDMINYSISDEMAIIISEEVESTKSKRGNRSEFFETKYDVVLYQLFLTPTDQEVRAVRNDKQEWGFMSQYQTWIPFEQGLREHHYRAAYTIHQDNRTVKGYTDFMLPKEKHESYTFLDFIYQSCGIENIRMREHENEIALSIKSGSIKMVPSTIISHTLVSSFIVHGEVIINEDEWTLISGYRRTSFELPANAIERLENTAQIYKMTRDEYLEKVLCDALDREDELKCQQPL